MKIKASYVQARRFIDFHTLILIGLPPPYMSIFSLVKGEKEHEVFEMRMRGRGGLNSYYSEE